MAPGPLNPARLPPGTLVGPWRVVRRHGMGTYGAVYLATGAEHDLPGPVALKLALYPRDARFVRERELLSRIHHPAIPRLWDSGCFEDAAGTRYPYLVMEFIEGVSLYGWAHACPPSSRQVLRLLAVLARALETTHAAGAVHRDVKGDNVLVRNSDGHVFLTDFGAGTFVGASRLTSPPFPPGTPSYRSPEAWLHVLRPQGDRAVPYAPGPADDLFALGVTAFRLVTEEYPSSRDPTDEASRRWYLREVAAPSPCARNARCCKELSDLIWRMLSAHPAERGSARELAAALERAARRAGRDADVPLFGQQVPEAEGARPPSRLRRAVWRPALAGAGMGASLALGGVWMLSTPVREEPEERHASVSEESKDGGTVALGDSALTAPVAPERTPLAGSSITLDIPPRPLPGQMRPDATGRCPHPSQVVINGSCWKKLAAKLKDCDVAGDYIYKGECYTPAFRPTRPSTSGPAAPSP
ncbi:serine/threonine-protein kinase [Pyxidicoccus sp. 3LG]